MHEDELTPRAIVAALDRFVVGQADAKRKVAIALRNRIRRAKLPPEVQEEVSPKNILMIGPTGVGKTEIARRLAKLVEAPFVKVEATRFTEVGYVGRDVESMVRDLAAASYRMVREEHLENVGPRADDATEERLLDLLTPGRKRREGGPLNPFGFFQRQEERPEREETPEEVADRKSLRRQLEMGLLEDRLVDVAVEENASPAGMVQVPGMEGMESLGDMLQNILPKQTREHRMTVAEARRVIREQEAARLVDEDEVRREAIFRAENRGIIFIDELDKVAQGGNVQGPDVSREGVQRDILPIVEGTAVQTKYGTVRTDHVLFIAAGAFHVSKPSDLIPELQGRFPVRVEFHPLTREDFKAILTEPESALLRQYQDLLGADGVKLSFTEDAIDEMAAFAQRVNEATEDIGARRLHTVAETVVEDLAFDAPDGVKGRVTIDGKAVRERLEKLAGDRELSRYIL